MFKIASFFRTQQFKPFYLILLIFAIASGQSFGQKADTRAIIQKFGTAMQIIEYAYVDSTDQSDLVETAIVEMLKELDPHSAYISKEDIEKVNEPLEGSFEGIGVTFQLFNDTILVVAPVVGGPSDKLGIMAGDKIIKIDGVDAFGDKVDNKYVMDRLRGKKGTKVDVAIKRAGVNKMIDFTITRDKIPLNSIDATYMVSPDVGYIKLTRFSKTSMDEFHESVAELKKNGMKDMILDLRGNSGGYLNVAVDLSDQFLSSGKLIVYTEGLRSAKQDFSATSMGDFEEGRVIILINEGSASASEIVSGAVQDWDRGLVLGRRSFGKGLVQRPFPLPDGSVIRLTTARYHTPTGRCIQRPYEDGVDEYYKELRHRLDNGELVNQDSIKFPDSLKYYTPGGRIVYGGGGVMPDVFVPIDSTRFSEYYTDLVRKGVFNNFTMTYIDKNRTWLLEEFDDLDAFKKGFTVSDEMYSTFLDKAMEEKVERNEEDKFYYPDEDIKIQIKALIARNLWDTNAYFEVINELDDELMQAVDLLKMGNMFSEMNLR